MAEQNKDKKILKLKFDTNKSEDDKKENITIADNNINKKEDVKEENQKITQKDPIKEVERIIVGMPTIIQGSTKSIEQKNYKNNFPFKRKTFIPKNENKFAPPYVKKENSDNKFKKPTTPFKKTNTFSKTNFKPTMDIPSFSQEKKNTFITKLESKKKKTRKESFKPKINETSKILTGNTFIGRIEYNTLEDPEFIKLKRAKKNSSSLKTRIFEKKNIKLTQDTSIKELANLLSIKTTELLHEADSAGLQINSDTDLIDIDLLEVLLINMGHSVVREDQIEKTKLNIFNINIDEETAIPRNPIVSIIGHVDHGKTSLVDAILKTNLTKKETGGITQTTKAYTINTKHGEVTLIDNPGHSAFIKMIERSIKINDISILIISGVDGVQEQTIKTIKLLKKSNNPFLIVLTKQDLPAFDADKIKQSLAQHDVLVKDYGGDIDLIEVSAKTNYNIDLLLETVALYGQVLDLKTNNKANAVGIVLESKIDPKTGVLCNLLIKYGNLKIGDIIISDGYFGKVKRIVDSNNKTVKQAFAGESIEVLGLNEAPLPGSKFGISPDNNTAVEICEYQTSLKKKKQSLFKNLIPKDTPTLNLLLKADSKGTLEALKEGLDSLNTSHSTFAIVDENIGQIKESDIELAKMSNALIVAFNVKVDQNIKNLAKTNTVKIIDGEIIYHLLDNLNLELDNIIKLIEKETYMGTAMIQMIFKSSKLGNIAGCIVKDGKIVKNSIVKIFRKDKLMYEGPLKSLKRIKDDVKEVQNGSECGMVFDFQSMHVEDTIKCYIIEYVKPE